MPLISISAIARNEENVIERFIKSIRDNIGDCEIVIVDTGSTDNTPKIAKSLGAKVIKIGEKFLHTVTDKEARLVNSKFKDSILDEGDKIFHYASARNFANSHCTGEWLISIDLHWVITRCDKLVETLKNMKKTVMQCSYNCILGSSIFETTRIYRRGTGKWYHEIHEIYKMDPINGYEMRNLSPIFEVTKVENAPRNYLPHLAYHFYLTDLDPNGEDYARLLFYFAREVYSSGKYLHLSTELLNKCMLNKKNWIKERSQCAVFLALQETDRDKKRFYLTMAINLNPAWREPYLRMAEVFYNFGDWSGVIAYAKQALEIEGQEGPLHVENSANYTTEPYRYMFIGMVRMIKICRDSGNLKTAIKFITQAEDIKEKAGIKEDMLVTLWHQAYLTYEIVRNMDMVKKYLKLCLKYNPEAYKEEKDRIFGGEVIAETKDNLGEDKSKLEQLKEKRDRKKNKK